MKLRVPHPRLLPATITVLGALLAVKTIDLIQLATGSVTMEAAMMSAARAQTPAIKSAGPENQGAAPPLQPPSSAIAGTVDSAPSPRGSEAATPAPGETPGHPSLLPHLTPSAEPAPPPVGEAERALLQDLRSRKLELDARDRATGEREAVLSAAEHKLSDRVEQLTALQARLETLDADRKQHDEANWSGLVRTYEAMKPKDAAVIFNDLDLAVLLPVLDRMKEGKAALVLAAMQPERARLVTSRLAQQRNQPSVTAAGG